VGNHKSHRRQSRMVEISLSGSGEGPGWETSRPTLQRPFHTALPAPPAPASPAALRALAGRPVRRPRPPAQPAALDRHRCGGGGCDSLRRRLLAPCSPQPPPHAQHWRAQAAPQPVAVHAPSSPVIERAAPWIGSTALSGTCKAMRQRPPGAAHPGRQAAGPARRGGWAAGAAEGGCCRSGRGC
jgi:hypothetical protein